MAGPVCRLAPLENSHIEMVRQWRNQERIRRNMYTTDPISFQQQRDWYETLCSDPTRRYFLFVQNERPIGVLNYVEIRDRRANLGYYLGEEQVWPGSGLLLELAALDCAFERLGLETLWAEVLEFNSGPQKMHDFFGYERAGVKPDAVVRDSRSVGAILFRYRREDWHANRSAILQRLPRQVREASARLFLDAIGR